LVTDGLEYLVFTHLQVLGNTRILATGGDITVYGTVVTGP